VTGHVRPSHCIARRGSRTRALGLAAGLAASVGCGEPRSPAGLSRAEPAATPIASQSAKYDETPLKVVVEASASAVVAPSLRPERIRIAAVGDVMLGSTSPEGVPPPPDDGARLLEPAYDDLRGADFAFGNLEGPLYDGTEWPTCTASAVAERQATLRTRENTCFSFRVPTRYAAYLRDAGFDAMSVANNHILDYGEPGLASSTSALGALGIATSGARGTIARVDVRGVRVAFLAFSTYAELNDLRDTERAQALVREATGGSDVVIVSFHGGAEGQEKMHVRGRREGFFGEDRGDVRAFAHAVVDAGADLVVGHGPHTLRGMELRAGRLIAYSLGNFATYRGMNLSDRLGWTLVLEAELARDGALVGGRLVPFVQPWPGGPRPDPRGRAVGFVRKLSRQDFGGQAAPIDEAGKLVP
jgi:hypothetical protein